MARQHRVEIIKKIGEMRGSSVVCYITGDRDNVNTRIAPDVTQVFYRHLEMYGNSRQVDLLLYTRGGDVLTPWRLVHLIREYTDRFCVLIPFRCYSAGTLLCLGADELVMSKMADWDPLIPVWSTLLTPRTQTTRAPGSG
jgi:ClpP class serine protease